MIVVAALVIIGGVMGFDLIMRAQVVITIVTGHPHCRLHRPGGRQDRLAQRVGDPVRFDAAGHRCVRVRADRVRARLGQRGRRLLALPAAPRVEHGRRRLDDLRRRDRTRSCCWSSGCCSPARRRSCSTASPYDPIGALAKELDTWALVPFLIVAVLGLVGGAILDIYSSGTRAADRRAAHPASGRRAGRRHRHDLRHDLRRVRRPRTSSRNSRDS